KNTCASAERPVRITEYGGAVTTPRDAACSKNSTRATDFPDAAEAVAVRVTGTPTSKALPPEGLVMVAVGGVNVVGDAIVSRMEPEIYGSARATLVSPTFRQATSQ